MESLKQLRVQNKMTQAQAAKYLQVSLRSYVSYENIQSKQNSLKYRYMCDRLRKLGFKDETHGILTLDEIKQGCSSVFSTYPVEYCYLFGSYSKSKAREASDVDLIIAADMTGLRYFGMIEKLKETLHKNIDALNLDQLVGNRELLNEVLKDGVKIYG